MLKIIFGQNLDGYQSPRPTDRCGEVILGPLSFLDLLEVRLGLRGRYRTWKAGDEVGTEACPFKLYRSETMVISVKGAE